jgi:hypothetical protein
MDVRMAIVFGVRNEQTMTFCGANVLKLRTPRLM